MAKTEDEIGAALRTGELTVEEALEAFNGDVLVYPATGVDKATATWDDIEESATGSTIFQALQAAGATTEQMDEVGANIERLRAAGVTFP